MEIARTEIFGPVLSIIPFENEDEAVKIANDTPYGLTNYIQTQDKDKVKRVARKLRSGMVDVNGVGFDGASTAIPAPFTSTIPDLSFLATLFTFSESLVWI